MEDRTDFIAYCIEEYKDAEKLTGKDVIIRFNRYNIIDYIKSCYDALHVMGGLAITADINTLIDGIQQIDFNKTEIHNLAAIRDALLPKFMNGEIEVEEE
jgi:hypothetical protein